MSEEEQLPDRVADPESYFESSDLSHVPENDSWESGNPTKASIPADAVNPHYLRTGSDLWLVYVNEMMVTEDTTRSLERFGYCVVLEQRPDLRFDEPGEAVIADVAIAQSEAGEQLDDIIAAYDDRQDLVDLFEVSELSLEDDSRE